MLLAGKSTTGARQAPDAAARSGGDRLRLGNIAVVVNCWVRLLMLERGGAPDMEFPADRFTAHRGLIAASVGGAMAEAAVLWLVAPSSRPLAPQATTLPPLAAYHDLRWLLVIDQSWVRLACGLVALLCLRAAIDTALIRLAWPRSLPPPRAALAFGSCLALTILVWLLLSPVVTLAFGVALVPFSWPFLAALPLLLGVVVSLSHGGVPGAWWRRLPTLASEIWLLTSIVVLSLAGAAIAGLPGYAAVPIAGLAGVVNARAWYGVAGAAARILARSPAAAGPRRRVVRLPLAPVPAVLVLALTVALTRVVLVPLPVSPNSAGAAMATTAASTAPARGAVMVVGGFGSPCCDLATSLQHREPAMLVRQFSYRGLDSRGNPLRHGQEASDVPLPTLGDRLATQIARLRHDARTPVDVVAESEGTLALYAALARHPDLPVSSVALLSPIVMPGQVSFPADSSMDGTVSAGSALIALNHFVGGMSPYGGAGAQALITSVNKVGARYFSAIGRQSRIRWLAVLPLADAITLPLCDLPRGVLVIPAFHGGLLDDPRVQKTVRSFLAGQSPADADYPHQRRLRVTADTLAALALPWRMPELHQPCGL
jgi:hypothetical protein